MIVNSSTVFTLAQNLLLFLNGNIFALFLFWLTVLVLEDVWSGLGKFLRIIFFPGALLYILVKYIVLKAFGLNVSMYQVFGLNFSSAKAVSKVSSPKMAVINIFALTLAPIFIVFLFSLLGSIVSSRAEILFLSWLTISIFAFSLPRKSDFILLFLTGLNIDISVPITYSLGFVVLALGSIIFELFEALILVFIYFLSVFLVTITFPDFNEEEQYIVDENFLALDE